MNFILLIFLFDIIESKKDLRVIGGRDAEENEYTYVARVEILVVGKDIHVANRAHICTSAILTPVWTLTAAHCVHDINKLFEKTEHMNSRSKNTPLMLTKDIKAVIWFGNVREDPSKNTYSDIVDGIMHPAAKFDLMNTYPQNDIGMFRTQPITIKQYTKLSALNALSLEGHEVELVGFGLTNSSYGGIYDTLVLKRPLQILTAMIKTCPDDTIMYPALCIARPCGQSSTLCSGDSGGPVLHPSGVVAVNSMAILSDCFVSNEKDRSHIVGILTPISSYLDWISDVINTSGKLRKKKK